MKKKWILLIITLSFFLASFSSFAMDRRGRLGVGFSTELANKIPAISLKLQKTKAFAFSGLFNFNSSEQNGGYGFALKGYRILFEEPQLNFYTSLLAGLLTTRESSVTRAGYQIDVTLGTEFSFAGIESLGFAIEFGLSAHQKTNNLIIETVGGPLVMGALHFYL